MILAAIAYLLFGALLTVAVGRYGHRHGRPFAPYELFLMLAAWPVVLVLIWVGVIGTLLDLLIRGKDALK